MIVVDAGNTRLKWAPADNGRLAGPSRVAGTAGLDASLASFIGALPRRPGRVLVANVAGERLAAGLTAALETQGVMPEFVEVTTERCGVRCGYAEPSRLGVDRWVAAIAAYAAIGGAVAVIDAGTTVTLDVVAADGRHLGGLIFVGPALVARALDEGTEGIGPTAPAKARPSGLALLGRSTDEAVGYAAELAVAAGLERALETVADVLRNPPPVILTGGDAARLERWLETDVQVRADLVLEGLALIADERR